MKNAKHLLKTRQKHCACRAKRLSIRYETCWNVTNWHAYHAKRSYTTLEPSKSDPFCRTRHRHGHTGLARTVADGCERLRAVAQRRANTTSTPRPSEWNGNPCYAFGKMTLFQRQAALYNCRYSTKDLILSSPTGRQTSSSHWTNVQHDQDHPTKAAIPALSSIYFYINVMLTQNLETLCWVLTMSQFRGSLNVSGDLTI